MLGKLTGALAIATITLGAGTAHATIVTFFDSFGAGPGTFDSTVSGTGGTSDIDVWTDLPSGTPIDRGDYSITKNDGSFMNPSIYSLFSASPSTSTSGDTVDISPSSTDVDASRTSSALRLTFDTAINGIGFEVGDWATCCQPSNLYISFDTGTPILVGESTVFGDQFLTNGGAGVFVGAIDDSDTFSVVEFWGDGLGEFLVAGGTVRYASVGVGTLPTDVPEPGVLAMLGLGLAGLGIASRRRRTA